MDFTVGTDVAGYRVEALLGRGGMGVVYRARQRSLDRLVALKVIAPELADDPVLRERFVRESRLAASIDHPNVIPIYEADERDGLLYIAMRYVKGCDLRQLLADGGPLPAERAAGLIAQVAAALDAAHAEGLVHRDVKPANVLVTPGPGGSEHVYLTDFGLVKRTASESGPTQSGTWAGTLDYVAPEQLRGDPVDARADVYALGCLLFEVLTGRVPFPRDSDVAKLWAHISEPPPALTALAPQLSPELDPIVQKALAKAPGDRYLAAGLLASTLTAAVTLGRTTAYALTPRQDLIENERAPTDPHATTPPAATVQIDAAPGLSRQPARARGTGRRRQIASVAVMLSITGAFVLTRPDERATPTRTVAATPRTAVAVTRRPAVAATPARVKPGHVVSPGRYRVVIPAGWVATTFGVVHAGRAGGFTESRWRPGNDAGTYIRIDDAAGFRGETGHLAQQVRVRYVKRAGYRELTFGSAERSDGQLLWHWQYFDRLNGKRTRQVRYFLSGCNTALALWGVTTPARWSALASVFATTAKSLKPRC